MISNTSIDDASDAPEGIDSDEIDAESEILSGDLSDELDSEGPAKAPRSGTSLRTVFIFSALAALIGGAIGALVPRVLDPANAAPAQAIISNQAKLSDLDAQLSSQQAIVRTIETDLADANNTLGNISRLSARLQGVEQTLEAQAQIDVSAERAQALAPLSAKLDAMETLMADEDMPEGAPSALLSRLDALEGQIEDLRVSLATIPPSATLSYRESNEGEKSELSSSDLRDAEPGPKPMVGPGDVRLQTYDLLGNFPRTQMLAALELQEEAGANPSWLRRLFSKHIEVRDTNELNARAVIDRAESLTRLGDIDAAISAIEGLNPALRAAAQPWIIQAKKTL